jgi:hypothetical protein
MSTSRLTVRAALALAFVTAVSASSAIPAATALDTPESIIKLTTSRFSGIKVKDGTVSATIHDGHTVLTLSDDFKIPHTPAPHWRVVDSLGNTYLLQRLKIKDDKINKAIKLPSYVHDVAKVQIWCAWAETLLGEASFAAPVPQ